MASATEQGKSSHRGFASMDPAKQREIASKGGKAAHAQGRAHEFTPDEARHAGKKGGEVVSQDRRHMAEIGREGGMARGRRERERLQAAAAAASAAASIGPASGTVRTTAPQEDEASLKAG
jgi:general stress protein YciG